MTVNKQGTVNSLNSILPIDVNGLVVLLSCRGVFVLGQPQKRALPNENSAVPYITLSDAPLAPVTLQ